VIRALLLVAGVAASSGAAAAGALDDCSRRVRTQAEMTPCLNAQKKAATDAMLEQFLAVEHSLVALEKETGRGGKVAQLKQSQRDFERYLHSHCQAVLRAYDSGAGAGQAQLGCEVDLLRSRAALLRLLAPRTEDPKAKE
jgi:uncharacterized protein YecT (DUF1311 family)